MMYNIENCSGKGVFLLNCMKCGREIALGHVFCKECLADMEQYPIKPGTPVPQFDPNTVTLPKRPTNSRKQRKPEEQLLFFKKWITGLSLTLFAVILGFSIVTAILVHRLNEADNAVTPGQNYSSLDTTN